MGINFNIKLIPRISFLIIFTKEIRQDRFNPFLLLGGVRGDIFLKRLRLLPEVRQLTIKTIKNGSK